MGLSTPLRLRRRSFLPHQRASTGSAFPGMKALQPGNSIRRRTTGYSWSIIQRIAIGPRQCKACLYSGCTQTPSARHGGAALVRVQPPRGSATVKQIVCEGWGVSGRKRRGFLLDFESGTSGWNKMRSLFQQIRNLAQRMECFQILDLSAGAICAANSSQRKVVPVCPESC